MDGFADQSPSTGAGRSLRGLRNPVVVAAFAGWNDAGTAASSAVEHLAEAYEAELAYALDGEDYYDYQVNRPLVATVDGRRVLSWPTTEIRVAELQGGRDLVLVQGVEPNMRWKSFAAALTSALKSSRAEWVHLLGALLADTPHTRPVPISATASDPGLRQRVGLPSSDYEGPTGIVGVLADSLDRAGLPAVSLWAALPHYVSSPPCPKATLALLSSLEQVADLPLDLGELPELARAWERGVDELAADDSEVAEYVSQLEAQQDETELPQASGDAIAAEFERYLRRRQGN